MSSSTLFFWLALPLQIKSRATVELDWPHLSFQHALWFNPRNPFLHLSTLYVVGRSTLSTQQNPSESPSSTTTNLFCLAPRDLFDESLEFKLQIALPCSLCKLEVHCKIVLTILYLTVYICYTGVYWQIFISIPRFSGCNISPGPATIIKWNSSWLLVHSDVSLRRGRRHIDLF